MKKTLFLLFVLIAASVAVALTTSCRKNDSKDAAQEPPNLPPIDENLFYSFFEGSMPDTVSFEGTIRTASIIPDPEKNDYPNCLYAVFVELDSVLSSTAQSAQIPYEVIVNVPVIKDNVITKSNVFQPGDMISCICAEYDEMPQEIREIQLSDDIQSFEHQQYYALSIVKVNEFQKMGNRNFAKREITILPIQSLPKDEHATALRRERIQKEIARIEEELKSHGGSFAEWKKEYETIAAKYKKLCDEDYKAWIGDSYFTAGKEETTYKTQEYINGLLPYKNYLEENNIDLILVRIPSKWDFAARVLASDDFQENPDWVEHYYEFLKNDIEVVDPMPEMWKHRFDYPLFYFYNIESEAHPFEGQAFFTAKVLSEVLKRYSFPVSEQKIELEDVVFETEQERFFWPEGNPKFDPKNNLNFKRVVQNGKTIGDLAVNTGSPFLFLSNSFFWYPQRSEGASVPGYTAYFLQHIPDWFYQSGIDNQIIRNLLASPEALQKRRAVIMVHTSRMNKNGFPPFPRYLSEHVSSISMEKALYLYAPEIKNLDNGSFKFKKKEGGLTFFMRNKDKKNPDDQFEIELTIPHCKDKTTCMLRFNFRDLKFLTINVLDAVDNSVIDTTSLTMGLNIHSDLFIPVPDSERRIRIQFIPRVPEDAISVKNLELWYY